MSKRHAPPKKLYKYCPVGVYSLRAISEAEVFHSPPIVFNDPLDCSPTIYNDLESPQLEELFRAMMQGETREEVEFQINMMRWAAGDVDGHVFSDEIYSQQLCSRILAAVHKELGNRGVLSLSTNWREPLMWSHYADQHKGICIEYDTGGAEFPGLMPVEYNASRSIRANDLYQWKIRGNAKARETITQTYFYAKAPQWQYENEWRDVVENAGVTRSNYDVTAIYLGIRCDPVWEKTIAKMLAQDQSIKIYKVQPADDKFKLDIKEVNRAKLESEPIALPQFKLFQNSRGILQSIAKFTTPSDRLSLRELYLPDDADPDTHDPRHNDGTGSFPLTVHGKAIAAALREVSLAPMTDEQKAQVMEDAALAAEDAARAAADAAADAARAASESHRARTRKGKAPL